MPSVETQREGYLHTHPNPLPFHHAGLECFQLPHAAMQRIHQDRASIRTGKLTTAGPPVLLHNEPEQELMVCTTLAVGLGQSTGAPPVQGYEQAVVSAGIGRFNVDTIHHMDALRGSQGARSRNALIEDLLSSIRSTAKLGHTLLPHSVNDRKKEQPEDKPVHGTKVQQGENAFGATGC